MESFTQVGEILMSHGRQLIGGLLIIFFGVLITRWIVKVTGELLIRMIPSPRWVDTARYAIAVLLAFVVVVSACAAAGIPIRPVLRLLIMVTLIVVGFIVLLRPMVPELPFKVGNTVKVGDTLGKVEATSFLNTRLRTYDGKTVFVPNRQILNDIVVNYHYTQTRRIRINLTIRYDSDLTRAKQILEEVMIGDPRINVTPRPVVYVLGLYPNGIALGARCWVANLKFFTTKSDLIEKFRFAFERENIRIPHTQLDLHFAAKNDQVDIDDLDMEESV